MLHHPPQVGLQLRLVAVLDHGQVVQDLKVKQHKQTMTRTSVIIHKYIQLVKAGLQAFAKNNEGKQNVQEYLKCVYVSY